MWNYKEVFQYYDKGNKKFLNKHEFKLTLIYYLGQKLRYDEVKKIWKGRLEYTQLNSKIRDIQGIEYDYFVFIFDTILKNMTIEKKIRQNFKVLDRNQKGYLDFDEFNKCFKESDIKYLKESVKTNIFKSIDQDQDGKISFQDFQESYKFSQILN